MKCQSLSKHVLFLGLDMSTWCEELTHWKRPWCWERLRVGGEAGDRGQDGWMASLNGHEFEQAPGDGERQRSLVHYSSWNHQESDTTDGTEWLNNVMLCYAMSLQSCLTLCDPIDGLLQYRGCQLFPIKGQIVNGFSIFRPYGLSQLNSAVVAWKSSGNA